MGRSGKSSLIRKYLRRNWKMEKVMNWGKNTRQRNSKRKGPEEKDRWRVTLKVLA